MNIKEIEQYGITQNTPVAKIIVILQDDSRKLLLAPAPILRQIIAQSVEEDGKGKLYIFDKISSNILKNDNIDLPCRFSS